jgi:hypothetical protein
VDIAIVPVESSMIASVAYNGSTLVVNFLRGGSYAYDGVAQSTYDGLMRADSVGTFFRQNVKDAHEYRQIETLEDAYSSR